MFKQSFPAALMAVFVLSACQANLYSALEPEEVITRNAAPPGAAPGTCWGRDETPAVIETVTEQILLQPAEISEDGTVSEPAVYRTEIQQTIVKSRQDTWFETPCDNAFTPEFTATVQRALKARGHYRGPITGRMDGRTRAAIRAYQKPQGLDSGVLSLAAARQMGLLAIEAPGVDQEGEDNVPESTDAVASDTTHQIAQLSDVDASEQIPESETTDELIE